LEAIYIIIENLNVIICITASLSGAADIITVTRRNGQGIKLVNGICFLGVTTGAAALLL